jgi:menaquinone-dependent protoporphyrinogen oxidase
MATFLLLCSTVDGHTLTICRRLQRALEREGHRVELQVLDDATAIDPAGFDRVVIGASIRYGRHRPAVLGFIRHHRALLDRTPSGFFSVNVVARKPGKDRPESNPYVRELLRRSGWQPTHVEVFAGRIDYPRYRRADRLLIRFIMWLTGGPTDPRAVVEFTDWRRVDAFARRIAGG